MSMFQHNRARVRRECETTIKAWRLQGYFEGLVVIKDTGDPQSILLRQRASETERFSLSAFMIGESESIAA